MASNEPKTRRGAKTRDLIFDTALALFTERGYEKTTMRAIAKEAEVSVGNAYYYFPSKEHLVQEFYRRMHKEHLAGCQPVLEETAELGARLKAVIRLKIEGFEPYHRFAQELFAPAADPRSPISPFSPESKEVREETIDLLRQVVEGSSPPPPEAIRQDLPELLWFCLLAVMLFWVYDDSEGAERSLGLVDRSVTLLTNLLPMAGLPFLEPLRENLQALIDDLRHLTEA